jgi:hypothetical protein
MDSQNESEDEMKRWIVVCSSFFMLAAIVLVSCKPAHDDLPEKEWTVTSVEYWINANPPLFHIRFSGIDDLENFSYYYKEDLAKSIDFKDFFLIPNIQNTREISHTGNWVAIETSGGTPTGDAVIAYCNKYFYEHDKKDGALDTGSWTAKVKIITPTFPVTINTTK